MTTTGWISWTCWKYLLAPSSQMMMLQTFLPWSLTITFSFDISIPMHQLHRRCTILCICLDWFSFILQEANAEYWEFYKSSYPIPWHYSTKSYSATIGWVVLHLTLALLISVQVCFFTSKTNCFKKKLTVFYRRGSIHNCYSYHLNFQLWLPAVLKFIGKGQYGKVRSLLLFHHLLHLVTSRNINFVMIWPDQPWPQLVGVA